MHRDWLSAARYHKFRFIVIRQRLQEGRKSLIECPIAQGYVLSLSIITSRHIREPNGILIDMPRLESLRTLQLVKISFTDHARLLYRFPNLESLSARGTGITPIQINQNITDDDHTSPPLSGSLTLLSHPSLIPGILSLPNSVAFEKINVDLLEQHVSSINQLFLQCEPSLKRLELRGTIGGKHRCYPKIPITLSFNQTSTSPITPTFGTSLALTDSATVRHDWSICSLPSNPRLSTS